MKAILHKKYGTPEELKYKDVGKPTPKDDEVLVKVYAASLNFGDKALIQGQPFMVRLMSSGLFKPKHSIPGGDIAGVIESVGANTKQFQPGDAIFAFIGELLANGKIVPVIDRRYPFKEFPQAMMYLGNRQQNGKIVITMEHKGD